MADGDDDDDDGLPFDDPADAPEFDGATYDPTRDHQRLGAQALKVFKVMRDHDWLTLREISLRTGSPEASVSARLRDFRKPKFGGHTVERQNADGAGLWMYRLVPNPQYHLVEDDDLDPPI